MITIGIDPHKASHTAAALQNVTDVAVELRVQTSKNAVTKLLGWAAQWPERKWAIEGANGLGRLLAQQLVAAGETVVDVPAKLACRVRLLQTGHGRKTDSIDAVSVAVAAMHHPNLNQVAAEDHTAILRLLSDRRDDLNEERRRTLNRLHVLLRDLHPGGAKRDLSADAAGSLLRTIRPNTAVETERKTIAKELLGDLRRIDRALSDNRKRCAETVAASGTTLTEMVGVSEVMAAKILGHVGDVTRFATPGHFASYSGVAPIEASSGDITRHRLNRGGNRHLNNALHLIARTQLNHHTPGRTHYERKLAEAKTPKEAYRSVKRQLSDVIYKRLCRDHRRRQIARLDT